MSIDEIEHTNTIFPYGGNDLHGWTLTTLKCNWLEDYN